MRDIFYRNIMHFLYTELKDTTITVSGLSLIQRDFVKTL